MVIFSKLFSFYKIGFFEKKYMIKSYLAAMKGRYFYAYFFGKLGNKSWIKTPEMLVTPSNIYIGNNVRIERGATLYCVKKYAGKNYNGKIVIGNHVYANVGLNISAASIIEVGDDVAFGQNVFLNDFDHSYEDIKNGVVDSSLNVGGGIRIGCRSWIGANVYISGGVTLGNNCIVGVNSVVTKSFPSGSVIAGVPAKLIKRYDKELGKWLKVSH